MGMKSTLWLLVQWGLIDHVIPEGQDLLGLSPQSDWYSSKTLAHGKAFPNR